MDLAVKSEDLDSIIASPGHEGINMVAIAEPTTQTPPMSVETETSTRNGANFVLNLDHLITEDDEPVDNIFSEKQQRLLTEPLYSSWAGPSENQPYLVAANVGVFYSIHRPAIVPDVFVALEVQVDENWWTKAGRSYLMWEHGKPPEFVLEIVSNTKGKETHQKMLDYARIGVRYYAVFDPGQHVQTKMFKLYELAHGQYVEMTRYWFEPLQLGVTLWTGSYENREATWLRWCDKSGQLIATGKEQAERAEQESQRAERLLAQLRALGIEPNNE